MTPAARLRLAWVSCIGVAVIAYVAGVMPERDRVIHAEERARALYDVANRDERILAAEASVRRRLHSVQTEVAAIGGSPASASGIVQAIDAVRARSGVRILAVTPGSKPAATAHGRNELQAREIRIALEGTYADVVAFLNRLSYTNLLVGVESLTLSSVRGRSAPHPTLHAEIDASVYRFDEPLPER